MDTLENKMLKLTLRHAPLAGESDGEFHHRMNSKLKELMTLFGWTRLRNLAANMYVSWCGHIGRMKVSPLVAVMEWRGAAWMMGSADAGALREMYPRRGRPRGESEDAIASQFGPFWAELTKDRVTWHGAQELFLHNILPRAHSANWNSNFLAHISHKHQSVLKGCRMSCEGKMPLIHLVDSALVANAVSGAWTKCEDQWSLYVKALRWNVHAFEHQWRFESATHERQILVQRLRHLNKTSDEYCNLVLDLNVPSVEWVCTDRMDDISMVIISSDGASRKHPGCASCAVWVQVVSHGTIILVAYKGIILEVVSNNVAEFEGACLTHDLLVQWAIASGLCI